MNTKLALDRVQSPATAVREKTIMPEERIDEWAFALSSDMVDSGQLPSARAVLENPACIYADYIVHIELENCDPGQPRLIQVGSALPDAPTQLPCTLDQIEPLSLVSRLTAHYLEPIASRTPFGFEAEYSDHNNNAIRYQAIGLPCATDGIAIDAMLGFIGFEFLDAPISGPRLDPDTHMAGGGGEAIATATIPEETNSVVALAARYTSDETRRIVMSYEGKIEACMEIEGALAVALVDADSGLALATAGGTKGLDLEVAAAGNTNVLKAKYEVMQELGIKGEIEDMMITLDDQIHMIRPNTSDSGKGLFMYLALNKTKANLAMARHKLRNIEKDLEV